MHGAPALSKDFTALPYANPAAPKGGRLTQGVLGSFDSTNPLIVQGSSVAGVREHVIESLMTRGLDEPFTLYGLLAESVEVPEDRTFIVFHLNEKARFSDGKPVSAEDVLFSWRLLKEKGRPNHRTFYSKVVSARAISPRSIRFDFKDASDRELPLILGLMPVLPRHAIDPETFDRASLQPIIGSGPYRMGKIDPGRSVVYERNPDYWGRELPINKGRDNFDVVRYEYARDATTLFEAFKRGEIDLRWENEPNNWAEGYRFPAVAEKKVSLVEFELGVPAGMAALVFNTRRQHLADARVRRALIALLDFEWINKNLHNGLYHRTQSFFERSALSSAGRPADDLELRLLGADVRQIKPQVLDGSYRYPSSDGSGRDRAQLREAHRLLTEAGYGLADGQLIHKATGRPFALELLAATRGQERLFLAYANTLARLGIRARVRQVDSTQYQRRRTTFDFDIIQWTWPASLSPGNEQLFRWSSGAADNEGSWNLAGVKSAAIDRMIDKMLAAEDRKEFVSAVRALDRLLISGDYVAPLFHVKRQWVAYWRHLGHPARQTLYGAAIDTWWHASAAK